MNKKKLAIILGSIFLVLIAIYLILNPAWITHPKYMLDKQYCEQDSECRFDYIDCQGVNLYHEKKVVLTLEVFALMIIAELPVMKITNVY